MSDYRDIPDASRTEELQAKGWPTKEKVNYEALMEQETDPNTKWAHDRPKYEFVAQDGQDLGDLGPRVQELEDMLFSDEFKNRQGENMNVYHEYEVKAEGPQTISPLRNFEEAGLHPIVLENIQRMKYANMTPVQSYVIPAIMKGLDVVANAQTGSGKTAAYLIPIFSVLMGKAKKLAKPRPNPLTYDPKVDGICAEPLVLIACPTRELALQIFDEARRLSYRSMLRPCLAYGGGPRRGQLDDIKRGCDILIGTPGRLQDFLLNEPRWLSLRRLKYTVLDEADQMLDVDWEDQMSCMLGGGASQADAQHQYMMFSATFPKAAREIARKYLQDEHMFVKVGRIGSIHKNVTQVVVWVDEDKKSQAVMDLIISQPPCRTLVFVNTTRKADVLDDFLYNHDLPVACIHSQRTQLERENALRSFRLGTSPVLIATGVSARGLDIKNVMHVVNFDLPSESYGGITEYIHRVGRTARIGHLGRATSFYCGKDEPISEALVKALMETNQDVPEFLEHLKPEKLEWKEDDSDGEGAGTALNNDPNTGTSPAMPTGDWGAPTGTSPAVSANEWGGNTGQAVDIEWT